MDEKKTKKSKGGKKTKKHKESSVEKVEKLKYETLEEIRAMENKELQSIITTRAYLEQYCTPIIQEAMISCAKKRPNNPLEYIGNYILERAHGK